MKIRIKGNSIRLRLTKTDVANLKEKGIVSEKTVLAPGQIFYYELKADPAAVNISANFTDQKITVTLSADAFKTLTETDEITVQGNQENDETDSLFLLIEKDLKCLDATFEDQSDMYENPKTHC